ncbi:hypothetical protein P170DRAFT_318595, partial [Aspergillus steynii IBT 23096]
PVRVIPPVPAVHPDEMVDEEACPHDSQLSFPAKPGMTLANSYQLLAKIGWGAQSTVWLAQDITRYRWQPQQLLAVKIIHASPTHDICHEREIESVIATQNRSHKGYGLIRTCSRRFKVSGPKDHDHVCMIYEPMREPLWILQK